MFWGGNSLISISIIIITNKYIDCEQENLNEYQIKRKK